MGISLNLAGHKYGKLRVVEFLKYDNKALIWLCKCDCGNLCERNTHNLRSGDTKSCGCLAAKSSRNKLKAIKDSGVAVGRKKISFLTNGLKTCSSCKETKGENQFHNSSNSSDKLSSKCKECRRFDHILGTYNLSKEEFFSLLATQNYDCPICKKELPKENFSEYGKSIHIDHCHKTGKVRGILHGFCNSTILRVLEINSVELDNATRYLASFSSNP